MDDATAIGRARTALVFGQGDDAQAVTTAVVASVRDDTSPKRVRVPGPVVFVSPVIRHVTEVILPIVDRITTLLGLPRLKFTLTAANLGAASTANLGFEVSGFSADLPVLLALLSASLQMPIPLDMVATGHVASKAGDFAAVEAIPAKLAACSGDPTVRRFIYPAPPSDRSLETLAPSEWQRIQTAVAEASEKIRTIVVGNVADLVQKIFDDDMIVMASLRGGFYVASVPSEDHADAVGRAAHHLSQGNECRFWTALGRYLMAGDSGAAHTLLKAWAAYHVDRQKYPAGFGSRLLQLVRSLPPAVRRLRTTFPLLSARDCIALSQFAGDSDHEDISPLYDAALGKNAKPPPVSPTKQDAEGVPDGDTATKTLEVVLEAIDPLHVAEQVAVPIDSARIGYTLDSTVASSYDEFSDVITSFYLHVLRRTGVVAGSVIPQSVAAAALDLLDRAFTRIGGSPAAFAEARDATRGGLRYVLDLMADRYKYEEQAKYVRGVLAEALDPLDWNMKVAFMRALLKRLAPHLPSEIRSQPPARFAKNWEKIVQAYTQSFGQIQSLLRTL
ncbi:MAG: hypothetical protein KAY37_05640 [Phycisphaerae bacterium]|nr:hypothetical protein [Phycisphaerae bacterium]